MIATLSLLASAATARYVDYPPGLGTELYACA
jgi:hypothetical protein